jgi:hypothetical protein
LRRDERLVEEAHERRQLPERLEKLLVEIRPRGELGLLFTVRQDLLELQVVRRRVVLREASRDAEQALALQAAEPFDRR